ncbi:MAG: hypothetical protein V8Q36_06860 [Anaerotignum sp.]
MDEARGSDGVVNIYDKAKVEVHDPYDDNFYMMDTDELVKVTYRSPAKPTDEWLNFSEKYDKDYETITFYKKTVVDKPEENRKHRKSLRINQKKHLQKLMFSRSRSGKHIGERR